MPEAYGGQSSNLNLETFSQQRNAVLAKSFQNVVASVNALTAAFEAAFPRITGTFTFGAAATVVVPQTAVAAGSIILLFANNASAGTLVGSVKSPYISARTVGASFTVATANAAAAAGTETFQYILVNPS